MHLENNVVRDIESLNRMFLVDKLWYKHIFFVMLILEKANTNIEHFSTFKRMDLYTRESEYPTQYCESFVCEQSGLSQVRIVQILDKENQIRNEYANSESISNIYLVDWSPYLALFARRKALLCLYSTDDRNVIFETKIFEEWFGDELDESFSMPVAIEVVMGYRNVKIDRKAAVYLYDELEDELSDFFRITDFNTPGALRRRGSVLQMGCDYVVRNNGTHVKTHLVCAYGILYFSDGISNDYSAIIGTPCSKCTFYKTRPYFRKTSETDQHWGCMPTFAFLCGEVALPERVLPDFRHDCSSVRPIPKVPVNESVQKTNSNYDTPDFGDTISPPYEWPCYAYAIPLFVLISIVAVVISYLILSTIVWKPRY